MKLLVVTTVLPSKRTLRTIYFKSILNELRKKSKIKIIWLVNQPDPVETFDDELESVRDIHEFNNGFELMNSLKPDIILVNIWTEIIQHSLSLAANNLKIPIVAFAGAKLHSTQKIESVPYHMEQRFFSNKVPTDSPEQEKFMRRGRFQLFKFLFSLKTRLAIKTGFLKSLKLSFDELFLYIFNKQLPPNPFALSYLLHNPSEVESLVKLNLSKEKLIVVGNPLLDHIAEKTEYDYKSLKNSKIKLLIVTDTLYEHGLWSSKQRDIFFNNLLIELIKDENLQFDFKIHPSSENKGYYEKLIKKFNIFSSIFQDEDLWDIIQKYDIAITFGMSTSHTEISYSGMRMIKIYDIGIELPDFPLVEEGIISGHIRRCDNISDLLKMIQNFMLVEPKMSSFFIKSREKLFYKHDGNACKRIADIMLKILKND